LQYFGDIPRGAEKPPLASTMVPAKFGEWLREVVEDDVMLPRLYLAFRAPPFGSDAYYAASVCGAVLGMRRGSRLHRALVREQEVASEATAFTFDLSKGSDLLIVDVTARPGVTVETLEAAVAAQVDLIRDEGVSAAEVERAVALIETDFVSAMQSAADRADKLSQFATYFGDPALVNAQADLYRAVTAASVSAFARESLGPDNRLSLIYVPRTGEAAA
jgi:predicted Zn-dependent peptidase